MENLKIIPYVPVDGIMTFSNSQIMGLYDRMVEDGTHDTVFSSGHIIDRHTFLGFMSRKDVLLYILMSGSDIAGMAWLDGIDFKTAYFHFCTFSDFWGQTDEIGKGTLKTLMSMKDHGGQYVFDLFKGLVPVWNTRAVEFSLRCGGQKLGVLPQAVWNATEQKSDDAAVIFYTRGNP